MSRGINKVILIGNLGADPDMRSLPSGDQVANLSLATTEGWNDRQSGERREKTEWHRIVAFGRLAEIIGQYCRKGSKIYIEGRLQTRKWTDSQGIEKYTTEIVANDMQMLDSRSGGESDFDQRPAYGEQPQYGGGRSSGESNRNNLPPQRPVPPKQDNAPNIDEPFDDDSIPF